MKLQAFACAHNLRQASVQLQEEPRCAKCDGTHSSDSCPHFRGERDLHKDGAPPPRLRHRAARRKQRAAVCAHASRAHAHADGSASTGGSREDAWLNLGQLPRVPDCSAERFVACSASRRGAAGARPDPLVRGRLPGTATPLRSRVSAFDAGG